MRHSFIFLLGTTALVGLSGACTPILPKEESPEAWVQRRTELKNPFREEKPKVIVLFGNRKSGLPYAYFNTQTLLLTTECTSTHPATIKIDQDRSGAALQCGRTLLRHVVFRKEIPSQTTVFSAAGYRDTFAYMKIPTGISD